MLWPGPAPDRVRFAEALSGLKTLVWPSLGTHATSANKQPDGKPLLCPHTLLLI